MANLRIVSVKIVDSSNIDVKFTDKLINNLTPSNVSIISETSNVPDSQIISVKVISDTLSISCQPLTQFANYSLIFQSTALHPFISVNATSKLLEDGVSNRYLINGPIEPDNPIKNYLNSYFQDNIYNTDENTVIAQYLKSLSVNFAKALYDIRQIKNENYLTFTVTDERHVRGDGPNDRLFEEAAYSILRVGRAPTNTVVSNIFSYDVFPYYPVSLKKQTNNETLKINSVDENGTFNINTFVLNLSKNPVIKLKSLIFTLATTKSIFVYNIEKYGYQILDSKYDKEYGFTYLQLQPNQIKLNEKILEDSDFELNKIIKIDVEYDFKNLGINVDSNSVSVYSIFESVREPLPPIINVFNLKHAPIVDSNNNIPKLNGLSFIDPNNPGKNHPAFITEIPFGLSNLPFIPGQYAIDYSSGTVYVYGEDSKNDGTGPFPPLASYKYRYTFKEDQDYSYDADPHDLVALPKGNLINNNGNIIFNYEEVFVPDVDYKAELHKEFLNERINNNLIALNVLKTSNSPITNVFQIYNETSGEIYTIDRWSDNKVYFKYNVPPRIDLKSGERATFKIINNELLFVNTTLKNTLNIQIYKFLLNNSKIISLSEDSIGSKTNTTVSFSNTNIFVSEKWFDYESSELLNIERLNNVGEYIIDYENGIVYCAVLNNQSFDLGTISYKYGIIVPQNLHIISVEDIYYQINTLTNKNKKFTYTSFTDGEILPEYLDKSEELYLNNSVTAPYQVFNTNVGVFLPSGFSPGITSQIKFLRGVFEYQDLLNSTNPINFSSYSSFSGNNVQVNSVSEEFYDTVKYDGTNYYVLINKNIPYLSPNITYNFSVIRTYDSINLWDNTGTIIPGEYIKLILPLTNSPSTGQLVRISYNFTINNLSRIVLDYNKGDYYIDYTYLADEILVSYECGDNLLDFRKSLTISSGDEYYVTYKVGALRDALIKNFGTLINVPLLNDINIDFNRERYRDALSAALTSFIQGPTLTAIKNIGKKISHIEPEVIESAFQNWSLGSSLLYPQSIQTTGEFQLLPGKFNNGVLIDSIGQTINLPANNNLRLEEGTFETWIIPHWNGLDNDASLTFEIIKDGYFIKPDQIFIGPSEYHPNIIDNKFSLNKKETVSGVPNFNKDGIYIYYHKDPSNLFDRWYFKIIDGYVDPSAFNYKIKINTNGSFYDNKLITYPKPASLNMFTGNNSITLNINDNNFNNGITFISDVDHYILDVGENNKNKISIYKDISGYLNFRVIDKNKNIYTVSAPVALWKSFEPHHIATSWKLNTEFNRDEMHLFIDGFEVPNIVKYGQTSNLQINQKFRTINSEEIVGSSSKYIISSTDLKTIVGSPDVSSSINFNQYNILPGDTIYIDEIGFNPSGYIVVGYNGQKLTLNTVMPLSLDNAKFSINRINIPVSSQIDVASNITVSTLNSFYNGINLSGNYNSNIVTSFINFNNLDVKPGYLITINDPLISDVYSIEQVSGNQLILDNVLPITFSGLNFIIYSNTENELPGIRALKPAYSFSKDINYNNVLTISNDIKPNDLILIRTLGLNNKKVKKQYYLWSNNQENILMTQLPSPISLDEVKIFKIILPRTAISPANSIVVGGIFNFNTTDVYPCSNTIVGRTLNITLEGNNTDFTVPVNVTITGFSGITPITETLTFNKYTTISSYNIYSTVTNVSVKVKPLNIAKAACNLIIKEQKNITKEESTGTAPVINYSYQINSGFGLYNDGYNIVTDVNNKFSDLSINNYLVIFSPPSVAGSYKILTISDDRKSLTINPVGSTVSLPIPSFTNGIYQVLNYNQYRSGLQNGFFTFESKENIGQPYLLTRGFYELEYFTYANIDIDPIKNKMYLGTDINGKNTLNGVLDQVKIYSTMLTDTRIGESIPSNQRSITKDFNSIKPLLFDKNTLVLINFNEYPFTNIADYYINSNSLKTHFQSSSVVNENFTNSIVFSNNPLRVDNSGILNTKKEGTIEFWVNPLFDTANDPHDRYYFDAFGAVTEETISLNSSSVKISSPASKILNIRLVGGDPVVDYFAGGKLEIDTQQAVQEETVSFSNAIVLTNQQILQVISVKILNDFTETDYFANGNIGTDKKTIYLGKNLPSTSTSVVITYKPILNNQKINTQIIRLNKKLPYQNSKVIVTYLPKNIQGDRISLFKDKFGYINFRIIASNKEYIVRGPTRWSKNTWHRVKASYKINSGFNNDQLRLFLDGYQYCNLTFGTGIVGPYPITAGSTIVGDGYTLFSDIKFKDSINEFWIGSDYTQSNTVYSLLDNFRISNIFRPLYSPYGEPLDVNYNSNLDATFPVTEDLYTTYLMNFDTLNILNTDFSIIKNKKTGSFDFSINIFDSYDIINNNIKSKESLETLIKILKPANNKVYIKYI